MGNSPSAINQIRKVWVLAGANIEPYFIDPMASNVMMTTASATPETRYRPRGNAKVYTNQAEALQAKIDLLNDEIRIRQTMLDETLAELDAVQAATLKSPGKLTCLAVFNPQMWQDDDAVDVDPGPTRFDVTDQIELMGKDKALTLKDNRDNSDRLRDGRNVPTWIKNWPGPFNVQIEDAVIEYFEAKEAALKKIDNGLARVLRKRHQGDDCLEP